MTIDTAPFTFAPPSSLTADVGNFRRTLTTAPGHNDRGGKYGVHGLDLIFAITGPAGAVAAKIGTDWIPDHDGRRVWRGEGPRGSGLSWHWRTPRYEGHEIGAEPCDYLTGGDPCHWDMSYTAADPFVPLLVSRGLDAVWSELERIYGESWTLTQSALIRRHGGLEPWPPRDCPGTNGAPKTITEEGQ